MRKLKRDVVISVVNGENLVGVYYADTNGSEALLETSPEIADLIIALWNGDKEVNCEVCGFGITKADNISLICDECAVNKGIRDKLIF